MRWGQEPQTCLPHQILSVKKKGGCENLWELCQTLKDKSLSFKPPKNFLLPFIEHPVSTLFPAHLTDCIFLSVPCSRAACTPVTIQAVIRRLQMLFPLPRVASSHFGSQLRYRVSSWEDLPLPLRLGQLLLLYILQRTCNYILI